MLKKQKRPFKVNWNIQDEWDCKFKILSSIFIIMIPLMFIGFGNTIGLITTGIVMAVIYMLYFIIYRMD